MEHSKEIRVGQTSDHKTSVDTDPAFGRLLMRPEVDQIAGQYGSRVIRTMGMLSIEIEPPIPKAELSKLGKALVELANNLDPTPPPATFRVI